MTADEISEQLVDPQPGEFLDDIEDSELLSGKFLKKEDFQQGMVVQIKGVARSQFRDSAPKYDLYIDILGQEKILTVTGNYVKELKSLFGKPACWTGSNVHIKAVPGVWTIQGKMQKGFTLEFSLP